MAYFFILYICNKMVKILRCETLNIYGQYLLSFTFRLVEFRLRKDQDHCERILWIQLSGQKGQK